MKLGYRQYFYGSFIFNFDRPTHVSLIQNEKSPKKTKNNGKNKSNINTLVS